MSCTHILNAEQWQELLAALRRNDQKLADEMPDDEAALAVMGRAYERLRKLGWRNACYCPKDGSTFEVIEAGSIGIHRAHYEGEWPDGCWWIHEDGDLWPSRPILFRLIRDAAQAGDTGTAETEGLGAKHEHAVGSADAPEPNPLVTARRRVAEVEGQMP